MRAYMEESSRALSHEDEFRVGHTCMVIMFHLAVYFKFNSNQFVFSTGSTYRTITRMITSILCAGKGAD